MLPGDVICTQCQELLDLHNELQRVHHNLTTRSAMKSDIEDYTVSLHARYIPESKSYTLVRLVIHAHTEAEPLKLLEELIPEEHADTWKRYLDNEINSDLVYFVFSELHKPEAEILWGSLSNTLFEGRPFCPVALWCDDEVCDQMPDQPGLQCASGDACGSDEGSTCCKSA